MNDHVFVEEANGLRFVGDFDGLYASEPDPWGQSAATPAMAEYYAFSRIRLVETLIRHTRGSCLEIGCGYGYLTVMLHQHIGPSNGMDIVPRAIEQARAVSLKAFGPYGPQFIVGDITAEPPEGLNDLRVAIWAQCWWYIMADAGKALANTLACIHQGGLFVISQAFLKGEQRYGADIAEGFQGALDWFCQCPRLRLIEARYDDSDAHCHHDGLLIYRKVA